MARILNLKFRQHLDLGNLLIATGDAELIEGNHWHDTYWVSVTVRVRIVWVNCSCR